MDRSTVLIILGKKQKLSVEGEVEMDFCSSLIGQQKVMEVDEKTITQKIFCTDPCLATLGVTFRH